MKILIKNGRKTIWKMEAIVSENNIDSIIEEIKKAVHIVENTEKFQKMKSEFREGAVKELTEGWK